MSKVLLLAGIAFGVLAGPTLAEPQGYPIGGTGDAWFQNQPSSIGISNGYDAQAQTYVIPGNPPYTVPANPLLRGRSATPRQ